MKSVEVRRGRRSARLGSLAGYRKKSTFSYAHLTSSHFAHSFFIILNRFSRQEQGLGGQTGQQELEGCAHRHLPSPRPAPPAHLPTLPSTAMMYNPSAALCSACAALECGKVLINCARTMHALFIAWPVESTFIMKVS